MAKDFFDRDVASQEAAQEPAPDVPVEEAPKDQEPTQQPEVAGSVADENVDADEPPADPLEEPVEVRLAEDFEPVERDEDGNESAQTEGEVTVAVGGTTYPIPLDDSIVVPERDARLLEQHPYVERVDD